MLISGKGFGEGYGQSVAEAVIAYQRTALNLILARRRRMFLVVHQLATRLGPVRVRGSDSALVRAQLAIVRDLIIAGHDESKALLIALAPLFGDASMKGVWLDLRRSGPNLMKATVQDGEGRFDVRFRHRGGRERRRSEVS